VGPGAGGGASGRRRVRGRGARRPAAWVRRRPGPGPLQHGITTPTPTPQAHIDWYTKLLGMKLLRFRDIPEGKYSNAFLGYNGEDKGFALEVCF
jgi:hypothetical protein